MNVLRQAFLTGVVFRRLVCSAGIRVRPVALRILRIQRMRAFGLCEHRSGQAAIGVRLAQVS